MACCIEESTVVSENAAPACIPAPIVQVSTVFVSKNAALACDSAPSEQVSTVRMQHWHAIQPL